MRLNEFLNEVFYNVLTRFNGSELKFVLILFLFFFLKTKKMGGTKFKKINFNKGIFFQTKKIGINEI